MFEIVEYTKGAEPAFNGFNDLAATRFGCIDQRVVAKAARRTLLKILDQIERKLRRSTEPASVCISQHFSSTRIPFHTRCGHQGSVILDRTRIQIASIQVTKKTVDIAAKRSNLGSPLDRKLTIDATTIKKQTVAMRPANHG